MSSSASSPAPTAFGETQFLSFFVAGEEYGVGILQVREILEYTTVTAMPSMPPCVRGVINLRGQVVPVIDLAPRFGFPETRVTKRTCIVMVELELDGERTLMGLLADSVSQVIELRPQDIEPPPSFGVRPCAAFLAGMGKTGRKFVLLLDLQRVLSSDDLAAAAAPAPAPSPTPSPADGRAGPEALSPAGPPASPPAGGAAP